MKQLRFEQMDTEELWALHLRVLQALDEKLSAEKAVLEQRLKQLRERSAAPAPGASEGRKYPAVLPKYRNPSDPSETWSGRGKTPRWIKAALASGGKLGDYKI
ncbi:H-NS histone family protein [Bradyrhizobium sp. 170]|uniref:H-NS histone family protein n=1 Tax=Bradyrhizobium sp. 170 TaxID=2782641 RepID=UPI00200001B7|nr:H-NS histone family protein [Bradyrhizobium sp. 170]UPK05865.1 H-NS histone family protein [Bradyrhizobium sp. 170]